MTDLYAYMYIYIYIFMYLYMNGDKWLVTKLVTSLADVRVPDISGYSRLLRTPAYKSVM